MAGQTKAKGYARLVAADEALVSYWRFGEGGGPLAKDATGRHHGEYRNVALGAPGVLHGEDDTAATFDGATSAVVVGSSDDFSFADTSPFSIDVWIKLAQRARENVRIISRRLDAAGGVDGYELVVTPASTITFNRHAGKQVDHLATARTIEVEEWAYVAATYDGEKMRIYLQGEQAAETAATTRLAAKPAILDIGRRANSSGTSTFVGAMDEMSISARALSADEIAHRFVVASRSTRADARTRRRVPKPAAKAAPRPDTHSPALDVEVLIDPVPDLWARTVSGLLDRALWNEPGGFNAAASLMLPLHAAFALERSDWIREFADHAERMCRSTGETGLVSEDPLPQLEYVYLWSRFRLLASGRTAELVPLGLVKLLSAEVIAQWPSRRPALLQSLERHESDHHAPWLGEAELCFLGIAADMLASEGAEDDATRGLLTEVRDLMVRLFASAVRWTADGWWQFDEPDASESAPPYSHRLPLVLESLRGAFDGSSPGQRFFDHLRAGLERRVGEFTPGSAGEADPSPPHAFLLGWWARLPGRRIAHAYASLAGSFPLDERLLAAYTRLPGGSHATVGPVQNESDLYELLARLAAVIEPVPGSDPVEPVAGHAPGRSSTRSR